MDAVTLGHLIMTALIIIIMRQNVKTDRNILDYCKRIERVEKRLVALAEKLGIPPEEFGLTDSNEKGT